ncbi:MAG: hypothetical protein KKC42_01315 [Candidatus Omnitrophica bacterium]|nr:hypothetical protein [Candidatus Omnitrophota bacterium]MBU1090470.1 hypothetical protein [Candidatus Omnitrophota bacterium]MBU1905649.1 hypothetical protein [Candidatus Omnitrophota bacterium]
MSKKDNLSSMIFLSRTGCLLPSLIVFNFFFGWIFFGFTTWLLIEGVLILLFFLNSYILMRRIASAPGQKDDVIDVEGRVVDDKQKLE